MEIARYLPGRRCAARCGQVRRRCAALGAQAVCGQVPWCPVTVLRAGAGAGAGAGAAQMLLGANLFRYFCEEKFAPQRLRGHALARAK
ncbi:hypothetical protein, partial [Paenibacillus gorillae]|uniref:hypothetical protein n=1 Tax=Paenibacillus gorillae TaxID=1243662 RepID=UPI0012DE84B6